MSILDGEPFIRGDVTGFQYRSALALAEAILPGSRTIPAADEASVARAEEVVRDLDPRLASAWRVMQATLSAAAIAQTGRPFHALTSEKQQVLLRRWEADPVLRQPLSLISLIYKFVHFDRPSVRQSMGAKLNVVNSVDEPRWLQQVHRADDWAQGDELECDVVVVGTGAGGAVVGRELADRGLAVVFVEEGEHHRRDAFDGSSVEAHRRFYRGAFSVGNAPMPVFMGRLVGGSTAINGGTCFRTPPWVLDRWCARIGTDELSPASMKPYFDRVEETLQVAPSDRQLIGPIADVIARGCDALGWSHAPIRRNAPDCDGSGFCDFGCKNGAKRGTNLAYIPPALEKSALLLTGMRAERVLIEHGRAAGIVGISTKGRELRVRARTVVLAGGAVPTPLFLLSQGICNTSGEVGRNLSVHPSSGFSAVFDEKIDGHAHIPQGYACDQFLRDGIMLMGAQATRNIASVLFPFSGRKLMDALDRADHLAAFALLVHDSSQNGRVWRDVSGVPLITYNLTEEDVDRMHRAMIHAGELCLAAGAKRLYAVTLKNNVIESPRDFETFRKQKLSASDIVWTSYHPLGTCKMGHDPKTSVVGTDHQTHDVPGLYIVDGSTVPGPIGVNPQITIMAMAARAAQKIADRL